MVSKQEEAKHLRGVQALLAIIHHDLTQFLEESAGSLIEERRYAFEELGTEISDDAQIEYSQVLPALKFQEELQVSRQELAQKLTAMKNRPYFGAVTIKDEGDTEKLYIGLSSLKDPQSDNIIIYDWRTPVASTYYENHLGAVTYQIPDVGQRTVDVMERIQLVIDSGTLIDAFDSELYIGDDALQHLLVDTAKDRMKSIVSTIQADQNAIIRESSAKDLLVLGPPGSGKTSIAMQRIAYLLYLHRHKMSADNMLMITPNHMFGDYISDVLPELGEATINAATFDDLKDMLDRKYDVETLFQHIERLRNKQPDEVSDYQLKSSQQLLDALDSKLTSIAHAGLKFTVLTINGEPFVTKEELTALFYEKFKDVRVDSRLKKMQVELMPRYEAALEKERKRKLKALKKVHRYIGTDEELEKRAAIETKRQFKTLKKYIEQLQFISIHRIYLDTLKSLDKGAASRTQSALKSSAINYEDIAPLVYLTAKIKGRKQSAIQQLIIDEVQDYSVMQMAAMSAYYPLARKTMLGDRNQIVHPVPLTFDAKAIELTKSYRSTVEITDFIKTLVPSNAESLGVHGEPVQTIRYDAFIAQINELPSESVAVITRTKEDAETLGNKLQDVTVLTEDQYSFIKGKLVMPNYMSKGFEFSHVFIMDYDLYDKTEDAKLLYTVASRATRHLYLVESEVRNADTHHADIQSTQITH